MEQKEYQSIQNVDNSPLMSNQQTVGHQPDKFILDFKGVYPQFTLENTPALVVNHKIILLDPATAKDFLEVLKDNISKYEKKFGKIKRSKNPQNSKDEKKDTVEGTLTGTDRPHYMG